MKQQFGLPQSVKEKSRTGAYYLVFMLLLGLAVSIGMTQRIARLYGYHTSLGQPLAIIAGMPVYAPFAWAV